MKTSIAREAFHDPESDAVDLLSARYAAAYDVYQQLVDEHADLYLSGSKPSDAAVQEEERAFDVLDGARQALLDAAARAYPTIH
jgi:methylaspartate ammonia-lyase